MDMPRFGDDRGKLLALLFRNRIAAYRIPHAGTILGYLFVQASAAGCWLGPWIADSVDMARELLSAALSATRPKPVIVALPGANPKGAAMLDASGVQRIPSSLRMVRRPTAARGRPQYVYGLGGGAIG